MPRASAPYGRIVTLAAALAVAYGCSLDWTVPAPIASPGDAAAADSGLDVGSAPPATDDGGNVDPSGRDGGATTGSCRSSADCAPTDVCIFAAFDCGNDATAFGICASRSACGAIPSNGGARYCGCDGQLYDSPCTPLQNGVDLGTTCKGAVDSATRVGFAICADGGVAVEDRTREHSLVDRCEIPIDTNCLSDCSCLRKAYCSSNGQTAPSGTCAGPVVHCQ